MSAVENEIITNVTDTRCDNANVGMLPAGVRKFCNGKKFRWFGSRQVLLILTWQMIIQSSVTLTSQLIENLFAVTNKNDNEVDIIAHTSIKEEFIISNAVLTAISCPVASLLAQVIFTRYKLVSSLLKVMWLLSVLACIIILVGMIGDIPTTMLYNILLFVIVIPQNSVSVAFLATSVPLGVDQLNGRPVPNIISFIQWLTWITFSGFAFPYLVTSLFKSCSYLLPGEVRIMLSIFPVVLLSIGLILDLCLNKHLQQEPVTVNPVIQIHKVLKYAVKHKYPVQRSAFTYCEDKLPTRLDNGKSKYGGPFTIEQVEDVKTFWRIMLVLFVLSTVHLSLMPAYLSSSVLMDNFASPQSRSSCDQVTFFTMNPSLMIVFFIPLYELIIYPCLRQRGPGIFKSIGIGATLLMVLSLYGLIIVTVQYFTTTSSQMKCFFEQSNESNLKFIVIPFNFILGLTAILFYKCPLEFICAQSPYNMTGLLIGLYYTFLNIYFVFGGLFFKAWKKRWLHVLETSECGIWFYLATLILAVISSVLLGCVMKWYKPRERDEIISSQAIVEEVYYRYREQELQQ